MNTPPGDRDDVVWVVDADDSLRHTRSPAGLGELLQGVVTRRRWGERLEGAVVFSRWEELVGPELARRCRPVKLASGRLVVRAESAVWATQLTYLAEDLVARLGEALRPGLVNEIKVVVGPIDPPAL